MRIIEWPVRTGAGAISQYWSTVGKKYGGWSCNGASVDTLPESRRGHPIFRKKRQDACNFNDDSEHICWANALACQTSSFQNQELAKTSFFKLIIKISLVFSTHNFQHSFRLQPPATSIQHSKPALEMPQIATSTTPRTSS